MAELHTTTATDWAEAEEILYAHTGDAAYALTELTALLDQDLHHLVLDPETRTVWCAWDNTPLGGEGWTVEQLTPKQAADQLSDHINLVQDRMDDPEGYAHGGDLASDQDALDEYTEILRLDIPAEPGEAAARIRYQRHLIARQDALWQRAYAAMVRDLAGSERGGKTRAAAALGITDMQVGRIIREDDKRRSTLANAVQATQAERPKETPQTTITTAEEWANALDAHMRTTGQDAGTIISVGYANGQILGVELDPEHPDADDERGVIVSTTGWVVRYSEPNGWWETA